MSLELRAWRGTNGRKYHIGAVTGRSRLATPPSPDGYHMAALCGASKPLDAVPTLLTQVPEGARVCARCVASLRRLLGPGLAADSARLDWLESRRYVTLTDGDTNMTPTRANIDRAREVVQ